MSMDGQGRKPKSEEGRLLRLAQWQWTPLYELMGLLCEDLLGSELLAMQKETADAGPRDTVVCLKMAERFEGWFRGHAASAGTIVLCVPVDFDPFQRKPGERFSKPALIERFIGFLRHCGGFKVSLGHG